MKEIKMYEDALIKTSDGKPPRPCDEYKDGYCMSSGDLCDACYSLAVETKYGLNGG